MAKVEGEDKAKAGVRSTAAERVPADVVARLRELAGRLGIELKAAPTRVPRGERTRLCVALQSLVEHPSWSALQELAEYERFSLADDALMAEKGYEETRERTAGKVLGMFHLLERAEALVTDWKRDMELAVETEERKRQGGPTPDRDEIDSWSGAELGRGDLSL